MLMSLLGTCSFTWCKYFFAFTLTIAKEFSMPFFKECTSKYCWAISGNHFQWWEMKNYLFDIQYPNSDLNRFVNCVLKKETWVNYTPYWSETELNFQKFRNNNVSVKLWLAAYSHRVVSCKIKNDNYNIMGVRIWETGHLPSPYGPRTCSPN